MVFEWTPTAPKTEFPSATHRPSSLKLVLLMFMLVMRAFLADAASNPLFGWGMRDAQGDEAQGPTSR